MKLSEEELGRLRAENRKLEIGRKDLEGTMADTTEQLREEGKTANYVLGQVQTERDAIAQVVIGQTGKIKALEEEIESLKAKSALLERKTVAETIEKAEFT